MRDASSLEANRLIYRPRFPGILEGGPGSIVVKQGPPTGALRDESRIRERFPHSFGRPVIRFGPGKGRTDLLPQRVGVVLSGGQAPGGHNVIAGILDGILGIHPESCLYGFIGGPKGIFTERYIELTPQGIEPFRNTGGFDLIGSGRDKIETPEQMKACGRVCDKLDLGSLVIIGGDDSNTNAAVLAEHFLDQRRDLSVVGVPKTIDGDLKGAEVEASFGFDTAVKVYSELIGNICRDSKSAGKYWHFVKLMGRSASHVTLECALQTRPNLALIGEEIRQERMTLAQIVERIAELVRRRAEAGKRYGVCLVPEGLIEFVPEMRELIDELNQLLAGHRNDVPDDPATRRSLVTAELSEGARAVFESLPGKIRDQLLEERDSHGNVQVSLIETESLLVESVGRLLSRWAGTGRFDGKLAAQKHFFGYEGRCAAPSNFDADYTYALGRTATVLAAMGETGYMCSIRNLAGPVERWEPGGVPLTSLMNVEERKGKPQPVIRKALVETGGAVFREFATRRAGWEIEDGYLYPGAIQYFGPPEVCDARTRTLELESTGN